MVRVSTRFHSHWAITQVETSSHSSGTEWPGRLRTQTADWKAGPWCCPGLGSPGEDPESSSLQEAARVLKRQRLPEDPDGGGLVCGHHGEGRLRSSHSSQVTGPHEGSPLPSGCAWSPWACPSWRARHIDQTGVCPQGSQGH